MKLTLKDFQIDAVQSMGAKAAGARIEVQDGSLQALVLAAPTGSGKTIMATRFMELLVEGDETRVPDPAATFLWITDQPDLNEQTLRKMLDGSSVFGRGDLITIENTFNQPILTAGKVYFLNTQKLAKDNKLVKAGDKGQTIWQTIRSTAEERPESFWVILDEAHKGMAESKTEKDVAKTIVQKFILGSPGEIEPIPMILGISATPERFVELLAGTDRTSRPVVIKPEDVRSSGLLKEAITLYHPEESQPSDLTLLNAAAEQLKRYEKDWATYAADEKATLVRPCLVVQVEDHSGKKVTKTDLAACISVLEEALGPLGDRAVGHSFQEKSAIAVTKDRSLRYVAPADIQEDPNLRVIFFKRALTTGWDCPRAEVMMSFRKAIDQTLIAQLVGRMVRTPLARTVSGSDFLNSVCLYLPYYDEAALDSVIEYLTDPDPDISFPTKVQRGEKLVQLTRNPAMKKVFEAANGLPTYKVEKIAKQSEIRRLLRLGRLLAWDKLDTDAPKTYIAKLVAVLDAERQKVAGKPEFKKRLKEAAEIDLAGKTVAYGHTDVLATTSTKLKAVSQNVEHAFAEAGRKLGGGLNSAYLQHRAAQAGAPSVSAIKLELYALLGDESIHAAVEKVAGELLKAELEKHKVPVNALPDERRQQYRLIRRQGATPLDEPWELGPSIEAVRNGKKYAKHLYLDDKGEFSAALNGWEEEVISAEIAREDVVGWLRNEPRKQWSFTVPYEHGKQHRPHYPDFIVFREVPGGIITDIIEPHAPAYEDSASKARGLADFARKHGDRFGRIELTAKIGSTMKRLDLNDIDLRDKVLAAASNDYLKQLYEEA